MKTILFVFTLCFLVFREISANDKWGCPPGSEAIFTTSMKFKKCEMCPIGSYQTTCLEDDWYCCLGCPDNTYSDTQGSTDCKVCQSGWARNMDRSGCDECPAGTYQVLSFCIDCPFGSDSEPGSITCNNGVVFNWTYVGDFGWLSSSESLTVQQNIENLLADPVSLVNSTNLFLYSAFNGIFAERIEDLIALDKVPEGSKEVWEAWNKVNWTNSLCTGQVLDALEATGQLILNAWNASDALPEVKKLNISNVTNFVEVANPSAELFVQSRYVGTYLTYLERATETSVTASEPITNIGYGFINNDFRQIGEAFGLLIHYLYTSENDVDKVYTTEYF